MKRILAALLGIALSLLLLALTIGLVAFLEHRISG
jgi:hypothetical protein